MDIKRTSRGFAVAEFTDFNGEECSIQDSSVATDDVIWLGVDRANPVVLVPGQGWQPVECPPDTVFTTRMHLSRQQVLELLPLLHRFLDTGSISL